MFLPCAAIALTASSLKHRGYRDHREDRGTITSIRFKETSLCALFSVVQGLAWRQFCPLPNPPPLRKGGDWPLASRLSPHFFFRGLRRAKSFAISSNVV